MTRIVAIVDSSIIVIAGNPEISVRKQANTSPLRNALFSTISNLTVIHRVTTACWFALFAHQALVQFHRKLLDHLFGFPDFRSG